MPEDERGTTITPVKKYPVARASSGREPEIANCENSRTAVTRSVTKTIASSRGKNMFSAASGKPENGAIAINATTTTTATATADHV